MANKYFKDKKTNKTAILIKQQKKIISAFPSLCCVIESKLSRLKCTGTIQPEYCEKYTIEIIYNVGSKPKIFIRYPVIEFNDEIHMFPSDNSLCLFHSSDLIWNDEKTLISETIIPWVVEWIIFYELWLITGKWLGKEIKHLPNKK